MTLRNNRPPFIEFFAGCGLVCEGLKSFFTPVWANDICEKKAAVFCANHPKEIFRIGPIEEVSGRDLPEAVLSWASFPCQDLSLAGNMSGISGRRSGLVWQWLRVMDEMPSRPPIAVAENVIYNVQVEADAPEDQILDLIRHTDTVAEVQNSLRQGVPDASPWTAIEPVLKPENAAVPALPHEP